MMMITMIRPLAQESGLQWLPAVGPSGQNLTSPPSEPWLASWWKQGPSVLGAIDKFTPRERAIGMHTDPILYSFIYSDLQCLGIILDGYMLLGGWVFLSG